MAVLICEKTTLWVFKVSQYSLLDLLLLILKCVKVGIDVSIKEVFFLSFLITNKLYQNVTQYFTFILKAINIQLLV